MLKDKNLTFRIPLLAAALLLLGGCYTMFSHPSADLVQGGYGDHDDLGDCASCHEPGFVETVLPVPCTWCPPTWIPPQVPGWVSSGGAYVAEGAETKDGRTIGGRGRPVGDTPAAPPPVTPGGMGPVGSGVSPAQTPAQETPGDSNRTPKQTRKDGADDTGKNRDQGKKDQEPDPQKPDPPGRNR